MTETECGQLCAFGVRTILDLRRPHEIERDGRIRETPGLAYHNIHPIHQEWDASLYVPEAGPARYLADRYLDMAIEGSEGLGAALRLIADPANAPLVLHCFAGKDRTGVLSALTLSLLGVAATDIAEDYARSEAAQAGISAQIRAASPDAVIADPPPMHFLVCPPEAMLLFLTELGERFGSVAGFVAYTGVTDEHVASLRAHLLD
ncbi:protein-tyrosine-phosphatase [Rugosimonospora africana]|uniref:Protein-tyrosine-phosphatase n=1 Tax=Rugosimonospora africana TaxID=556532 RepID=A0A8J3QQF0_9ACTN|nr:protein-tyrosine-phosphatase [Rugosimonospora africana]